MTIVLLEGVDAVGKSTLAAELGTRLNAPVWCRKASPLRGLPVEASQAMHETEWSLLSGWRGDIVVDRFVPSEWAYNMHFARKFDAEAAKRIMDEMRGAGVVVAYLRWPLDDPIAEELAFDERSDGEVSWEDAVGVQLEYDVVFDRYLPGALVVPATLSTNLKIEAVMRELQLRREPSPDGLYMAMAEEAATRSTCLSRRTGAVLVSARGHVIATGFNGAPRGCPHQDTCPRLRAATYASGGGLDECDDVHAEENALIQAALSGSNPEGGTIYTVNSPCHRCVRMLINARVGTVVYGRLYGDTRAVKMCEAAGIEMRRAL